MKKAMVWMVAMLTLAGAALPGQAQEKTPVQPEPKPLTQGTSAQAPVQAAAPAQAKDDLTGNWQGTLQVGPGSRVLIKMTKDGGQYKATMYLIDGGGQAIGIPAIALHGSDVSFAISLMNANYTGTLNPDGNTISGSAKLADGSTHALNLERVSNENAWTIPEPPKPMAKDAQPKFDVVTVKPGKPNSPGKNIGFRGRQFIGRNFNVDDMIALGYGLHTKQIVGAPDWFNSELYDIEGIPDTPGVPSLKQQAYLMQDLLATRFGLRFHHEQRELSVFVITVGKSGSKMQVSAAGPDDPVGFGFRRLGDLTVRNMTMADFAIWMQGSVTDRPIVDQTGLKDRYDFTLKWTPDDSQFAQFRTTGALPSAGDDPNAPPALNDAIQQQIGLRIEPVKAMDDVIVIDHAEHPSAN